MIAEIFQALYSFFSQFGTAYMEGTVPSSATYPYLTYSATAGDWLDTNTLAVSIYSRSESTVEAVDIADKLIKAIDTGISIPMNKGFVYITAGAPLLQVVDDGETNMKHLYIVLQIQTITGA